jgi:hypothetical protein
MLFYRSLSRQNVQSAAREGCCHININIMSVCFFISAIYQTSRLEAIRNKQQQWLATSAAQQRDDLEITSAYSCTFSLSAHAWQWVYSSNFEPHAGKLKTFGTEATKTTFSMQPVYPLHVHTFTPLMQHIQTSPFMRRLGVCAERV